MNRLDFIKGGVVFGLVVGVLLAALPSISGASGTITVVGAPSVTPGVQYFGNTSSDGAAGGVTDPGEFWSLNLVAGDQVGINVESTPNGSYQNDMGALVYPAGTSDATMSSSNTISTNVSSFSSSSTASEVIDFTAPSTGVYPIYVFTGPAFLSQAGPFNFSVEVHPAAVLFASSKIRTATKGSLTAYVRTPDGTSITDPSLVVTLYGSWKNAKPVPATWHVLARGTPSGGKVIFHFALPAAHAHTSVRLRLKSDSAASVSSASTYQSTSLFLNDVIS